ncbi:hypothetical protein M2451_000906 [Dysgonomonas sp. PFB1-18]|nr:hypothetical protein [Dysgonomonas sp. PF1-14]MDH6338096.1 hypothetical protein [Dysgonomonas sp. PF1-16]MDH6379593.1 hypothetical protein [Dysgonomonas sp. PFB1-18]MDH6396923.1 hypothetical protein [Dysgonomonas sp. PF1-23]
MFISSQKIARFATVFPFDNLEVSSILLKRELNKSEQSFLFPNLTLFRSKSAKTTYTYSKHIQLKDTYYSICAHRYVRTCISLVNNFQTHKNYLIFLKKKLDEWISTAYHRISRKSLHVVSKIQIQCLKRDERVLLYLLRKYSYCLQYLSSFHYPTFHLRKPESDTSVH